MEILYFIYIYGNIHAFTECGKYFHWIPILSATLQEYYFVLPSMKFTFIRNYMFIFYKEVLVMVHPFFQCHALVNKQQNVLHTCIIYNILLLWKKKYLIFVKFIENLSSFLSVQNVEFSGHPVNGILLQLFIFRT